MAKKKTQQIQILMMVLESITFRLKASRLQFSFLIKLSIYLSIYDNADHV